MTKIYVSTCDSHDHLLKPFMYLFNKFWSQDVGVTILGYRDPPFELFPNFDFISLAKRQDSPSEWGMHHRKFFESIDDDHFIWTVEDSYLLRQVDFRILGDLESFAAEEKIGRISLINPMQREEHSLLRSAEGYEVIEATQDSESRISVVWSIWNRKYALDHLRDTWSPWDVERNGSQLAKNDGFRILGSRNQHAIDYASAHRVPGRGLPNGALDLRYTNKRHLHLDRESIQELIDLKMITPRLQIIRSNEH